MVSVKAALLALSLVTLVRVLDGTPSYFPGGTVDEYGNLVVDGIVISAPSGSIDSEGNLVINGVVVVIPKFEVTPEGHVIADGVLIEKPAIPSPPYAQGLNLGHPHYILEPDGTVRPYHIAGGPTGIFDAFGITAENLIVIGYERPNDDYGRWMWIIIQNGVAHPDSLLTDVPVIQLTDALKLGSPHTAPTVVVIDSVYLHDDSFWLAKFPSDFPESILYLVRPVTLEEDGSLRVPLNDFGFPIDLNLSFEELAIRPSSEVLAATGPASLLKLPRSNVLLDPENASPLGESPFHTSYWGFISEVVAEEASAVYSLNQREWLLPRGQRPSGNELFATSNGSWTEAFPEAPGWLFDYKQRRWIRADGN